MAHTAATGRSSKEPSSAGAIVKAAPQRLGQRRLAAWLLEIGLLIGGGTVPWLLGQQILAARSPAVAPSVQTALAAPRVSLNPAVDTVYQLWIRVASVPPSKQIRTVPPATNLLWTAAIAVPIALATTYTVTAWRYGTTWPRQRLGLRLVSVQEAPLSLGQVVGRELCRWGIPGAALAGIKLTTGITAGPWTPLVLGSLALLESLSALGSQDRRPWHDRWCRTRMVPVYRTSAIAIRQPSDDRPEHQMVHQPTLYGMANTNWWLTTSPGNLTSVVMAPSSPSPPLRHRAIAGSITIRSGWRGWLTPVAASLGLVGIGVGIGWSLGKPPTQPDRFWSTARAAQGGNVEAILMLAQIDDPRSSHYLSDLLSQSSNPDTLAAIQQALISQGLDSLPFLRSLNQTLHSQLSQADASPRVARQQRTVQQTIAALLAIHSGQLQNARLDGVHLARQPGSNFSLIQPGLQAAGSSWKQAQLRRANLSEAIFFQPGPDGLAQTHDDIVSHFEAANLEAAQLRQASLQGNIFDRANLRSADLSYATANGANFEATLASNSRLTQLSGISSRWAGSNLVGADMTQADFTQANFSQARLSRTNAPHSVWRRAMLSGTDWLGANLIETDFSRSDLQTASFQGANLQGATLTEANLKQVSFQNADLRQTMMHHANLAGADFSGAIFIDPPTGEGFITPSGAGKVQYLTGSDFSQARNLDSTQLDYICDQGGIHPACHTKSDQSLSFPSLSFP